MMHGQTRRRIVSGDVCIGTTGNLGDARKGCLGVSTIVVQVKPMHQNVCDEDAVGAVTPTLERIIIFRTGSIQGCVSVAPRQKRLQGACCA